MFFVNFDETMKTYDGLSGASLREELTQDILSGQSKHPMHYFMTYFSAKGTSQHPQLGNLNHFVDEIERQWRLDKRNYVCAYIKKQIAREPSLDDGAVFMDISL